MYRHGSHTVSRLTVHIVWITKYRYHVLTGDIQKRCRELIIQLCDAEDIKILYFTRDKLVDCFYQRIGTSS